MQRLTAIAILAMVIHTVTAQDLEQRPPQDRFRAGVELVEVDVIVTDRLGQPVRGLTAEDFEIREDGEAVEIAAFDAIELPDPRPEVRPAATAPVSGAAIHNNLRALEGGIYVILLDFSTSPGIFDRARKAALALINELGPTDQVAMMSTGGQKEYQVEFTTDRARLARALERLVIRGSTMEDLPDLIGRIASQLEPIPARRKVVALISEGFHFDPEKPEYLLAFDAAHRANLAVYAFDPKFAGSIDGMIEAESATDWTNARTKDRQSVAGLQTLAANTGGRATVRTNFIVEGVRRMLAENRSYYLLRYYSRAPRDGKFHRISVTTRRPGLDVRSRPGFTAPRASTRPQPQPPPLDRLAGSPIQAHGLDMRAVAVPVPSSTRGGSALVLVAELHGADLLGAPGIELVTLAVDMSGKVRARDTYAAKVSPDSGASNRWVRIVSRLNVPPGRYQVRLAARRTDGKASGSVFVEIDAPKFSRALVLGGLVIGTRDRRGVARPDLLENSLPVVPFATSELPQGIVIGAGLPLKVAAKHRALRLNVQARLSAADGTVYDLLNEALAAAAFSDIQGGMIAIPFPKDPLPAGEYRLTVDVGLENQPTQQRELTFAVGRLAGE